MVEQRDANELILKVSVKDQGIGMTREETEHVFEPFWASPSSLSLNPYSNGVGLFICKQICESLDGDIKVESAPELGSKFTFTMAVFNNGNDSDSERQIKSINYSSGNENSDENNQAFY